MQFYQVCQWWPGPEEANERLFLGILIWKRVREEVPVGLDWCTGVGAPQFPLGSNRERQFSGERNAAPHFVTQIPCECSGAQLQFHLGVYWAPPKPASQFPSFVYTTRGGFICWLKSKCPYLATKLYLGHRWLLSPVQKPSDSLGSTYSSEALNRWVVVTQSLASKHTRGFG